MLTYVACFRDAPHTTNQAAQVTSLKLVF